MTVYEQKTKTHIPIPLRVDTSKHYTGIDHGATIFAPSAGRFVTTEPSGFFYDPTTTHTYNRTWKGAWLWSVRAAGMRSHSSHRYFFATTVLSFKPHLNLPRLQIHPPLFRPNAPLQLHNQRSVSRSHRNDHASTTTPAQARPPPPISARAHSYLCFSTIRSGRNNGPVGDLLYPRAILHRRYLRTIDVDLMTKNNPKRLA